MRRLLLLTALAVAAVTISLPAAVLATPPPPVAGGPVTAADLQPILREMRAGDSDWIDASKLVTKANLACVALKGKPFAGIGMGDLARSVIATITVGVTDRYTSARSIAADLQAGHTNAYAKGRPRILFVAQMASLKVGLTVILKGANAVVKAVGAMGSFSCNPDNALREFGNDFDVGDAQAKDAIDTIPKLSTS
ncbi:MAG: hypothetical protein ACLP8S_10475 [Solirubrobacteraceae bacterium]